MVQVSQSVAQMAKAGRRVEDCEAAFREIGAALAKTGADALLAPLQLYSLNVALDERIPVSDGKQEFYRPILRQVELAENPAYTSGYNGIGNFLRQQGATWRTIPAAGRAIVWDVKRPFERLSSIPNGEYKRLCHENGEDLKSVLRDRNLDTWWSPGATEAATLECDFAGLKNLQLLRLLFAHGMTGDAFAFPRAIRIEVKTGGQWKTVLANDPIVPLEWSGARVFFPSGLARLEYRMDERNVEGLRVTLLGTQARSRSLGWRLAEVNAFGRMKSEPPVMDIPALDVLGERLQKDQSNPVIYAPRWVSNQLLNREWISADRLPGLIPRVFDSEEGMPRDGAIITNQPCIFVVERHLLGSITEVLASHHVASWQQLAGPWAFRGVRENGWNFDGLGLPPAAVWTGDTLMLGNTAARAAEALRRLRAGGEPEEIQKALLGEIVKWRPALLAGLSAEDVERLGGEKAVRLRETAACVPPEPCATEFANGIRLEGIAVEPGEIPAGGEVAIRLFWSAMDDCDPDRELVFIHLRDAAGKIVAQDDYRGSSLLWGPPAVRPVPGEIVEEKRIIRLPAGIAPGPLDVAVGLYSPQNGRRVKIRRTDAPQSRRRAAIWSGQLRVAP